MNDDELRQRIAEALDAAFDDYRPRYDEVGKCVDSNAVDAVLAVVSEQVAAAERFQIAYHAARAELASYAAVIERVRMLPARVDEAKAESWLYAKSVVTILSTVNTAAALSERDAKKWEEGFVAGEQDALKRMDSNDWNTECSTPNPYKPKVSETPNRKEEK